VGAGVTEQQCHDEPGEPLVDGSYVEDVDEDDEREGPELAEERRIRELAANLAGICEAQHRDDMQDFAWDNEQVGTKGSEA